MKLFVSYARVDKPLCKQIVDKLEDVHEVWYDKRLHAGQAWWEKIEERLAWCEGFVYLLSPESVASEYCQREYRIASEAGKYIFPVLIQARTEIPESLQHLHYANLSEGMEDILTLMNALTSAERTEREAKTTKVTPKPVTTRKPPTPPTEPPSSTQALAQAADALELQQYDNAVFLIKQALAQKPTERIGRMLQGMLTDAETALEQQTYLREAEREYAPIRELITRDATRGLGCAEFVEFQRDFPDYDPDDLAKRCQSVKGSNTSTQPDRSIQLFPAPFGWVEIAGGEGKMKTDESAVVLDVPTQRYWIAKYPVTKGQFAKFIEADGYKQRQWWTEAGWKQREKEQWAQPRYWTDGKWNGATQPVVGVSWYEAIAFCQWLSEASGKKITLPSEAQWQYAAQGTDGRAYPWGKEWDGGRCNNSVSPHKNTVTTPVTAYEGKGDSPFGVVDMAGNVWEWCLTDYNNRRDDINGSSSRVLRGGSWVINISDGFRCDFRYRYDPYDRNYDWGFRLALS